MDAHLFRAFASLLEPALTGARIEKIQEFGPDHLAVRFYGNSRKRNLYLRFSRQEPFAFLSDERVSGLARPSALIMRIRKYFGDKRIAAVVIQVWSRKIWLMAGGANPVWLCLDLARGASLHFLEEDEYPEAGDAIWPSLENLRDALADWRGWPVLTPALRRALAELDYLEQAALLTDLADGRGDIFLYEKSGEVRKISAWPLPPRQKGDLAEVAGLERGEAFARAGRDLVLGALAERNNRALALPGQKREKKLRKLLEKLDADETRLKKMIQAGETGELLSANLWRLDKSAKLASIEIDGREISLDCRFAIVENMERLFREAGRGKRGLEMLRKRRCELLDELKNAGAGEPVSQSGEKAPDAVAKKAVVRNLPGHAQAFVSSDGYVILRGKDARGNTNLLRFASGHDIWAHVEKGAGAHVIIRRPHAAHELPERTLLEAGTLAANKSWLAEAASGSIMFAECRHVRPRRGAGAGNVTIDKIRLTLIAPVDHGLEEKLRAEV